MKITESQKPETSTSISYAKYSSTEPPDNLHPAFCFKHLDKKLGFPEDKKHRNSIINTIHRLGTNKWAEIRNWGYGNGGFESIPKLKDKAPLKLPNDATVLAFHCSRDGRMIGFRDAKIFYVFWFDWSPFKIYKHS